MEKKDLGDIKTIARIKDGVKIEVRLFNKRQRQIIKDSVENRADGMTIEDVLNIYKVSPAVYYTWLKNEKEEKKVLSDRIPNPLEDSLMDYKFFSSESQLKAFYLEKSPELKTFIDMKFKEWMDNDLISQIASKVTSENIFEVAKAGNITMNELRSFLQRENKDLSYFSVEAIKRYLKI
jgi:hypothetical protein